MAIKTLIAEDEIHVREALVKMLHILAPEIKIVATSESLKDLAQDYKNHHPDLIFLDIELADGNAFEWLRQAEPKTKIIFTTAYSQYAIDAFKYSAVDYLLKPIDPADLKTAVERAVKEIQNHQDYLALQKVLVENVENQSKKIVLKTTEHRHIIPLNDIIRVAADGAYSLFYTDSQEIIVSRNLKYYEKLLGTDFIRCHQSHLINLNQVASIYKSSSVMMKNGDLVPISSRKKTEIVKLIFSFLDQ